MKTINWNRKAVEQAKAQGFDNPGHAICPSCGTQPAMRQFKRYQCECHPRNNRALRHPLVFRLCPAVVGARSASGVRNHRLAS